MGPQNLIKVKSFSVARTVIPKENVAVNEESSMIPFHFPSWYF